MKYIAAQLGDDLRIAYREFTPSGTQRGTIVLLHGFPQTSYQYRHALPLLADKGYRCIAPDYRGAGGSSRSHNDFTKATMAADILKLLDYLQIEEPIHLVGHDIGGMIAFAFAHRYPKRVKTVCWGECPLPGTKTYYRDRTEHAVQQFHFIFHCIPDLPEALIRGNERIYLTHFFNKIAYNLNAFTEADIDHYVSAYSQPGAIRCGLDVYRAFEKDAEDNLASVERNGKVNVPTMVLSGARSRHKLEAEEMVLEVTEKAKVEVGLVEGAAHYLAEENPEGFAETVLAFIEKHA
ncbi:hypothetical protein LTR97_001298 [Elasticomyces elasticus]|uniref:AB hydrolase-1 domain-containing protein n=1 Tax=Elasticomyces elasticus TaxID=574655 RepID=A0AAN8A4Y9_9PEZI|nr:hypothetical protein LTR97_001298 [Elasticomyces elasticus]KAK5723534.1 hypothetical protein LTR15_005232 [Elasticomyces elasticus]